MALTGLDVFGRHPISYLGTDSRSVVLFRVGLLAAAVLLAAFTLSVRRTLGASVTFVVASLTGLAGQGVAAIVPLTGPDPSHQVHTIAALVLGISLPVLMWRFAAGAQPNAWRIVAYRLFWLEMAACGAGVLLSRAGKASIAEILPAGVFHLWIILLTVRSRQAPNSGEHGPDGSCPDRPAGGTTSGPHAISATPSMPQAGQRRPQRYRRV